MKLRLFAIALILLGIGSAAFAIIGPSFGGGSSAKYTTATVSSGTVAATSVATGSIASATVYGLRFGVTADIVSSAATTSGAGGSTGGSSSSASLTWPVLTVSASVGQRVSKGTALATADATAANLALSSALATLSSAQSKLATDSTGPDALTLAQAKNQLAQSQNSYNQALANRASTRAQNALSLAQAQAALASARATLAADQATVPPVPAATIDKDNAAIAVAGQSLASTQLKVSGSNTQANQQVTNASLSYQAAKLAYQSKIAPASTADIAADQALVASAQSVVNADQLAVTNATLRAPADGLIIAVNILPGVNAPSSYAIEESIGPMIANAAFAEADISKLAVGQSATVSIGGAAVSVPGAITQIVPASAPSGTSNVVTYAVTVTLSAPPDTVFAGMSATVTITTASVDNVLRVPTSAISGSDSAGYNVLVLNGDGSVTTTVVQIGLVTTAQTQITGGLSVGETVVTGTVSTRSSTTSAGGVNSLTGGLPGGGFGR